MNIVKLQDDLKAVPDQALIGYVQNPDGQVPSYLALSEIQRRKKMREQAQGTGAAEGAQPSVAEQLVAEAQPQPQQGIASIPVENVGNEAMYAAGGIIAFEGGGDVQGYATGKEVKRKFLTAEQLQALTAGPDFTLYPYDESTRYKHPELSPETMKLVLPQMPVVGDYPQLKKPKPDWYTQGTQKGDVSDWYVQRPTEAPILGKEAVGQTTPANIDPAYINQLMAAQPKLLQGIAGIPPQGGSDKFSASSTTGAGVKGLAGAPASGFNVQPIADDSGIMESLIRPSVTVEGEAERYAQLMGEDTGRAKMNERIAGLDKATAEDKRQYPWMALAEAGLGMAAGKSPNAITNIAEGGKQGIEAYGKGRDRVRASEEKLFDLQAKVAAAERDERRAAVDYGINSEERTKASNEKNRLQQLEYKQRIAVANKNIEVEGAKYGQKEREMLLDAELKKAQIAASREVGMASQNEIQNIMRALRADPKNQGVSDADLYKTAYETKGASSIYGANTRASSALVAGIDSQLEKLQTELSKTRLPRFREPIESQINNLIAQRAQLMGGQQYSSGSQGANVVDFSNLK